MLAVEMCFCPEKINILANLNLSKIQKTSLAIGKVMFFIEKVTCLPVEKSCISQAAPLVLFHFGPILSLGYIGATFPRATSTSENAFFYKIVEQLSTQSHDKF